MGFAPCTQVPLSRGPCIPILTGSTLTLPSWLFGRAPQADLGPLFPEQKRGLQVQAWKWSPSTPKVCSAPQISLATRGTHAALYVATLLLLGEHRVGVTDLWQLLETWAMTNTPQHTICSQTPLNAIK